MISRRHVGSVLAVLVLGWLATGCGNPTSSPAIPALDGPTQPATSDAFEAVVTAADKLGATLSFTVSVSGATGLGGDGSGTGRLDLAQSKVSTSFNFPSTGASTVLYFGNNMYFRVAHPKNKSKPWLSFAASDPNATPVAQISAPLVMDPVFLVNEIRNGLSTASPVAGASGGTYDLAINTAQAQANASGNSKVLEQQAARSQGTLATHHLIRMRVTLNGHGELVSLIIDQSAVGAGRALFTFAATGQGPTATPPPTGQVVDVGTPSASSEGEVVPGADGDAS